MGRPTGRTQLTAWQKCGRGRQDVLRIICTDAAAALSEASNESPSSPLSHQLTARGPTHINRPSRFAVRFKPDRPQVGQSLRRHAARRVLAEPHGPRQRISQCRSPRRVVADRRNSSPLCEPPFYNSGGVSRAFRPISSIRLASNPETAALRCTASNDPISRCTKTAPSA